MLGQIWGREVGGLRPPRTPLLSPRTSQKAFRALGCSGWSLLRDRATCPGQLRFQGQIFLRNPHFFEETTCPGQLRCQGQNFLQKSDFCVEATCPGQLRCLGQIFSRNPTFV